MDGHTRRNASGERRIRFSMQDARQQAHVTGVPVQVSFTTGHVTHSDSGLSFKTFVFLVKPEAPRQLALTDPRVIEHTKDARSVFLSQCPQEAERIGGAIIPLKPGYTGFWKDELWYVQPGSVVKYFSALYDRGKMQEGGAIYIRVKANAQRVQVN